MKPSLKSNNTLVIAESKWIQKDLDVAGIKYIKLSLLMSNIKTWT